MATSGQQLGLRLFLEGIEVPVVAAQVQVNINAPATAAVQIVPSDRILELKARTMIHLFFWDYSQDLPGRGEAIPPAAGDPPPPSFDDAVDPTLQNYKLLFSGEVIGISVVKTPSGRQSILQCADFSTYWDTTYQFFISYGPHGNFLTQSSAVWAGGASLFNDIIDGHTSVMNDYLRRSPKTPGLQDVKGLMGGIISLLEVMGGVPNHLHGVNDFFTIAELKNHLLQQIAAEQNDDTAQRLFDSKAFMEWLNRGISSLGQLTTFRDMLKLLFQFVYYETVPNPSPLYVPRDPSKKRVREVTTVFPDKTRESLEDLLRRSSLMAGDASFNVDITVSGNNTINATPDHRAQAKDVLKGVNAAKATKNIPAGVVRALNRAALNLDTIAKSPTSTPEGQLRRGWRLASNAIGEAIEVGGFGTVVTTKQRKIEKTKPKVDRLLTQIFRPDCFFAAPPRCNVLFPEQYTQFSFSRNFLQEVTRLRLTTGWIFGTTADGLLANHHFAPSTKSIRDLAKKQGNNGIRALLPWEKFSGILPKFETCSEINYIAGRSERKLGINKSNIQGAANDYAQRAANFNYMKYRFASRSCEISSKFNPFVVCGFPAVVISQPFSPTQADLDKAVAEVNSTTTDKKITSDDVSDHIREIARAAKAPTQYLGMVAGMAHNVDQQGGSTSITLTHARTHRVTDDDFLSIFSKEVSKTSRRVIFTVLDAEQALQKGDWKTVDLLIKATPQDIPEQMNKTLQEEKAARETPESEDDVDLGDRPTGLPTVGDVAPLSFVLLNPILPSQETQKAVIVQSDVTTPDGRATLRGKVATTRLKGSRQIILEPDPYSSKLKVGSKGPKGGKIVQIQCFNDSVLKVSGADINKAPSQKPKGSQAGTTDEGTEVTETATSRGKQAPSIKTGKRFPSNKIFFMWRKIAIYEEDVTDTGTAFEKLIPAEEAIRPPWFSPLYSNWLIGDNIYRPFFGTGSVVDQALFSTPSGSGTFGTSREKQNDILAKIQDAQGDNKKISEILEDAKASSLSDVPDIESSVDVLAYVYGEIRRMGLDVHRFVQDYVYRPIATMEDIFGTKDLEYQLNSAGTSLTLVSGTPGFHSTAVLPPPLGQGLLGLLDNPDIALPRLREKGKKSPVSKDLDPRPDRRAKVQAYVDELQGGAGTLGIGLSG
jgi:hypothetical protein